MPERATMNPDPLVRIWVPGHTCTERKRQRPYNDPLTGKAKMGPRTDEADRVAWKMKAAPMGRQAMRRAGYKAPFACPLRVLIIRCRPQPKSWPSTDRAQLWPEWDCVKPDATNFQKLAEDALNGIVWDDDGQIVGCGTEKEFGAEEGIEVIVWDATATRRFAVIGRDCAPDVGMDG